MRHKTPISLTVTPYEHYTIAWVCALHIEMAAARAMLHEVHEPLPAYASDSNTYVLGSIERHGVVIACLPSTQYGTNNAANLITNLKRTFPSIRLGLVVGIGGGAPSMADIRLGDVVVGTSVIQYDLGKIVEYGQMERIAIPKIPQQCAGTLISALRSKHELEPGRVPSILRDKLTQHPDYGRPRLPDRLFESDYTHKVPGTSCDVCDQSRLVLRSRRVTDDPIIHYGAVASGNQVMRDSTTRDVVARQLDVLCFEMEAAGLMDILPCLPIRGICDYSDSHKNEQWQRYAAATAAAYATELLEILPVVETQSMAMTTPFMGFNNNDSKIRHIAQNEGSQFAENLVSLEDIQAPEEMFYRDRIMDKRVSNENEFMRGIDVDLDSYSHVSDINIDSSQPHYRGAGAIAGLPKTSASSSTSTLEAMPRLTNSAFRSAISIKSPSRSQCGNPICSCFCHVGNIQTPLGLKRFFGALRFRGSCTNHASHLWELRYWIPQWLSNYNLYLIFERTASGSPSFGLKFPRKLSWGGEDTIIRFSFVGDVDGIRSILDSGKCSLDDVDPNHGRTALHYAVLENHHYASRLLLDQGADRFMEDVNGSSATQEAWERIFARRGPQETLDHLQILFPVDDIDDFGFSALHKAVLHIEGLHIPELIGLGLYGDAIDARDTYYHRSPLHWAALRGDLKAVELLLDAGANINATDGHHCTPLIYAVSSGTHRVVEVLILRGAGVNMANSKGETPLHCAARYMGGLETVKTLVRAGAQVDQRNMLGNTPLSWAAIMNRVSMGEYLLQQGADRYITNENGDTPLRETIHQNCHDFLQMLVEHGTRYNDINTFGCSILHVLALEGDTKTVEILGAAKLGGLDTELRNKRSETPMDICRKRVNPPEGFRDAFLDLLLKLDPNTSYED